MVSPLDGAEIIRFHPHASELGGLEEVKKMLGYVASGSMAICGWSDGSRKILAFRYQTKRIIIIWGNGNPTMFPANNEDRIRTLTSGLNPLKSVRDLNEIRHQIADLGRSL